jgi:hypothetical protein
LVADLTVAAVTDLPLHLLVVDSHCRTLLPH